MSKDLTTGSVTGHLWRVAAPASLGMFFETMFNFVDTYWAGTLSTTALAALSVSFPVFFLIISLTQGLSTAASALASYHWGRKDEVAARNLGGQVISYAFMAAIALTVMGLTLEEPLFALLGVEGEYLAISLEYINTIFYGAFLFVFSSGVNGLLLAHGNSRVMRNVLVGGFFLNCVLDPWFLYGGWGVPPMGVKGIALATLFVKLVGMIYVLSFAWREGLIPHRPVRPDIRTQLKILRQAVPASMNMLTIASGILVTNYFLKPYGVAAVGAYGISLRIEQVFILPVIGLAIAVLAISGQNYGAKRFDRVARVLKRALGWGLAFMTVGAGLALTIPDRLVGMFSDDREVIAIGAQYLRVAALISWSYPIISLGNSVLQGLQCPILVFCIGVTRQFVVRVLAFYAVATYTAWGLLGFWWTLFVINWLAAIVTLGYTYHMLTVLRKSD